MKSGEPQVAMKAALKHPVAEGRQGADSVEDSLADRRDWFPGAGGRRARFIAAVRRQARFQTCLALQRRMREAMTPLILMLKYEMRLVTSFLYFVT